MVNSCSPEPKRLTRLLQAARALAVLAPCAGLVACGDPVNGALDLYHGLEGGEIAQQRPPPPGPDMPYQNLASVPPRPKAPDIAAQEKLADQLAAQRDAALAAVAQSPVPVIPPATPPAPAKPAAAPASPPAEPANKVVVAAADPSTKPADPAAKPAPAPLPTLADVPAVAPPVTAARPTPSLAGAPPAPAGDVGLAIPATPAPAPAPAPPPPAAPPPAANTVQIAFTPGSSELPPSATLDLRKFALAHRGVALTITGHGGEVLPSADSQARALDLALKRAQAIAASLSAAGVPAANLHVHADAAGQGGSASL